MLYDFSPKLAKSRIYDMPSTSLLPPISWEKRKSKEFTVDDVQGSFQLFYDPARNVEFVQQYEQSLISD